MCVGEGEEGKEVPKWGAVVLGWQNRAIMLGIPEKSSRKFQVTVPFLSHRTLELNYLY